ncbi:MAG: sulfatase-like hydrolase/transferase [Verrucomicrobiales bacterium]|nr:sulfatase-like hydrolase/transferase [Verrucomicrobiales bacterium]
MKGLLVVLILALAICSEARPPNIVVIVADDLGYGDLGCYGSEVNRTPHIDALAAGGLRFTDYHSAGAMCSPTRASMLTGLYPQRFGASFDGALSQLNADLEGLPLGAVTIAEKLQENGYATACFGKWHLGYVSPLIPTRQGFDEFRGLLSGDGDHHTQISRLGQEDWYANDSISMEEGYTADLITRHSVDFIREHRDEPFFLYVPHLAIHFPWQAPDDPPHRKKGVDYRKDKWGIIPAPQNVAPHVQGMIQSMDESVGNIVKCIHELDLANDTLVIFTSDNGGYLKYGPKFQNISSNGVYRGQKTEIYEGGHRVPLIVSWPGKINPGIRDSLVHSNDWMPTLLVLAGVGQVNTDGVDLLPHLLHGSDLPDRTLYWRARSGRAVRQGPWKLCAIGKRTELYHLENDPGETTNLAAEHPGIIRELSQAWDQWNEDVKRSAAAFSE